MRNFMSRHSLVTKVAGVAVAAATAVVVAAGTASATEYTIFTSDAVTHGGQATFNTKQFTIQVDDLDADGYAVWGQSWDVDPYTGDHKNITTVETVGGISDWAYTVSYIPNKQIHFIVCLRKGTNPVTFCTSKVVISE